MKRTRKIAAPATVTSVGYSAEALWNDEGPEGTYCQILDGEVVNDVLVIVLKGRKQISCIFANASFVEPLDGDARGLFHHTGKEFIVETV